MEQRLREGCVRGVRLRNVGVRNDEAQLPLGVTSLSQEEGEKGGSGQWPEERPARETVLFKR